MKRYTHLFFDLDHTLWDFDTNARQTLKQLHHDFRLDKQFGTGPDTFIAVFFTVLHELWDAYNESKITKAELRQQRFARIAERLTGQPASPMPELEDAYVNGCSRQGGLMPHTLSTLRYLREAGYRMHILTNGFRESQQVKLETSGIAGFFETVTTSECTGAKKPHPAIFRHALEQAQAQPEHVILIGDNPETDLKGAYDAGWDTVFYNPGQQEAGIYFTHQVACLSELTTLF